MKASNRPPGGVYRATFANAGTVVPNDVNFGGPANPR